MHRSSNAARLLPRAVKTVVNFLGRLHSSWSWSNVLLFDTWTDNGTPHRCIGHTGRPVEARPGSTRIRFGAIIRPKSLNRAEHAEREGRDCDVSPFLLKNFERRSTALPVFRAGDRFSTR